MQCYCVLMYLMFWKSFLSKRKSWLPYLATSAPVSGLIPINYLLNFRSPSTRSRYKCSSSHSGALRKHFLQGVDLLRHWNIIIQMRIVVKYKPFLLSHYGALIYSWSSTNWCANHNKNTAVELQPNEGRNRSTLKNQPLIL